MEIKTMSVCPKCFSVINAKILKQNNNYYMEKKCKTCGTFKTIVWRGNNPDYYEWSKDNNNLLSAEGCPNNCGICANHKRGTCCVLLEVTDACNLECPICFAESRKEGSRKERSLSEFAADFRKMREADMMFLQLSGGEPTMRDDLPEIVKAARYEGLETIQLNTNGLRLASDRDYLKKLKNAGLSFVFLQFDGLDDNVYKQIRGRSLLAEKEQAIEACKAEGIGVTLVPTVVPGVNDSQLGAIIEYGMSRSPAVRGVHFQPISYFGRHPSCTTGKTVKDDERITLPEIMQRIVTQTNKVKLKDLKPSACDHALCGFHSDFAVLPNGMLLKLTRKKSSDCCSTSNAQAHKKNRAFVARRWTRSIEDEKKTHTDMQDLETFVSRIKSNGFTITAMAFQDAYTIDLRRLQTCSLHVYNKGQVIPFCRYYMDDTFRS